MAGNSENDKFEGWAWAFLISAFILPLLIAAGALVSVVAALFWLIGKLILGPLKGPISRRIDIQRHSAHWRVMRVLYLPVMAAALLFTCYVGYVGIDGYFVDKTIDLKHLLQGAVLYGPIVLGCGLVFNFLWWVREAAVDPEVQKRNAGASAERTVRRIIERAIKRKFGGQSLHNTLLVFRPGTDSEFSAELDHVLVTPRNLYLVETKYRSGLIYADENASEWQVSTHYGDSSMRNALKQVKNSANVIRRELGLGESIPIIPLVAIVGNGVEVRDGPSNVVAAFDLDRIVTAFENSARPGPRLDPEKIVAAFAAKRAVDSVAFDKHVKRIEEKRSKDEMDRLVRSASIN